LSTLHGQAQAHGRELVFTENVSKMSARNFLDNISQAIFWTNFLKQFLDNYLIFKLCATAEQMPALVQF
jgi:hypothetical protein